MLAENMPIEKAHIPGGSFFSQLMSLCLPWLQRGSSLHPPDPSGKVHPMILLRQTLYRNQVFKSADQAIAAMAMALKLYRRCTRFSVGELLGYAAKQYVSINTCSIDMPAGPSELAVVADISANPAFVASDLLSQAEHGPDSQVLFITTEESLLEKVSAELALQLEQLPRKETATAALGHSRMLLFDSMEIVMKFINEYAPEHLILQTADAHTLAEQVTSSGSVFIGHFTPESAGDYASGTNHTLLQTAGHGQ